MNKIKKISLLTFIISLGFLLNSSTTKTEPVNSFTNISDVTNFDDGFKDGWCDGYKDPEACGSLSICPIAPISPIPKIGQSYDSYKDGYTTGFKAGLRKGMSNCG
tara:strand:+ start:1395 stop:1709 length:315 start_codon:yes stop_codon:yes gene_type:complete